MVSFITAMYRMLRLTVSGLPFVSVYLLLLVVFSSGQSLWSAWVPGGYLLYSYDTGTISGILAMPYWLRSFSTEPNGELTAAQDSLIVSILSAGTFFGALTAAPFGDLLGRRWGLMASAGIVFNLGVILQTIATEQPLFIAGRFFAGYGVGLVSALSKSVTLVHPRSTAVGRTEPT